MAGRSRRVVCDTLSLDYRRAQHIDLGIRSARLNARYVPDLDRGKALSLITRASTSM